MTPREAQIARLNALAGWFPYGDDVRIVAGYHKAIDARPLPYWINRKAPETKGE